MKHLLLLLTVLLAGHFGFCQTPQQFAFQGAARDAAGKILANQAVSLRFTIRQVTALGLIVYQETQTVQTSQQGIFSTNIGAGTVQSSVFADIDWNSKDMFFLQIELDPAAGNNYINLGATQLVSVPYALHAHEAERWKNDEAVVQATSTNTYYDLPTLPTVGDGPRLIWYPRKAAFRAGYAGIDKWEDPQIGTHSTAFGQNTVASGLAAAAIGFYSSAGGDAAFAAGRATHATGHFSTAFGSFTRAEGRHSAAMGFETVSKAFGGLAIGIKNDDSDTPGPDPYQIAPTDRIFQIGVGSPDSLSTFRKNAMTVLYNGNVGIGNVVNPQFTLDVAGRARIRNNAGATAGIYFDDSNNNPTGFVGLKTNTEIGFYNASKWLFWMDATGNAHISGATYNSSDNRLKRDFSPLKSSLTRISDLNGYHYFWKNPELDQSMQTGLIAQEVEGLFPELVKTDEKGFKSVNYQGFIPHLIEAVKELEISNKKLSAANDLLNKQNNELKTQVDDAVKSVLQRLNSIEIKAQASTTTAIKFGEK